MTEAEQGLSLVIPAFNEEHEIALVIERSRAVLEGSGIPHEIVVIDDASTDATLAVLRGISGITLLRNERNSGYGFALKRGIAAARYPLIGIIDADNTYPPEDLPRLVAKMESADMAVGWRECIAYTRFNALKQAGRLLVEGVFLAAAGRRVPDINSGMRIFRRDLARSLTAELCDGFSFTTTLTLLMIFSSRRLTYEPIHYQCESTSRSSKVKLVRDGMRTIGMISGLALRHRPLRCAVILATGAVLCAGAVLLL